MKNMIIDKAVTDTHESRTVPYDLFEFLLKQRAEQVSKTRILARLETEFGYLISNLDKVISSHDDMLSDWVTASTIIGSWVLHDNIIHFSELNPECYKHLEHVWLNDIKRLRAYFLWEQNSISTDVENYFAVCNNLHSMIVNQDLGPDSLFHEVCKYIEDKYLKDGLLDENKESVKEEIKIRAYRIWTTNPQGTSVENWNMAKNYLKEFYESIIPATQTRPSKHIRRLFKSFNNNGVIDPYGIVSCFELLLMSNFLNKGEVKKILLGMEPACII